MTAKTDIGTEVKTEIGTGILIAGGYGVVGRQVAMLIRQRYLDLPLVIGGRSLEKAEALASELGNARGIRLDVEQVNPLKEQSFEAVVAVVNDPHDYLLRDAVRQGIPFLDVTRWPERFRASLAELSGETLNAPVLLASGWMAGVASVVAAAAAKNLRKTEQIDVSVLFSVKDKSGPNSVEYMEQLATPFESMVEGRLKQVFPYSDPRRVTFPGGYTTPVYRFDTPDQLTLPQTTGAKTVATRIAFDDAFSTNLLRFLARSGIWRLISGERFTALRRSLLYNPGDGAGHEIHIMVAGQDNQGMPARVTATIVDPQGQTHLTALGALIQLEWLLGLDGALAPAPDILFPDANPQIEHALQVLSQFGVNVSIEGLAAQGGQKLAQQASECLGFCLTQRV